MPKNISSSHHSCFFRIKIHPLLLNHGQSNMCVISCDLSQSVHYIVLPSQNWPRRYHARRDKCDVSCFIMFSFSHSFIDDDTRSSCYLVNGEQMLEFMRKRRMNAASTTRKRSVFVIFICLFFHPNCQFYSNLLLFSFLRHV